MVAVDAAAAVVVEDKIEAAVAVAVGDILFFSIDSAFKSVLVLKYPVFCLFIHSFGCDKKEEWNGKDLFC